MTTDTTDAPAPEGPAQDADDPVAEVARLKDELAKARKWEERAKSNSAAAKELEALKAASATDTERAIAQARAEARAEAYADTGGRLVDAEVRAAVAGRNIDVKALLEGLDRGRFLTDEGEPNVEAIQKWVDRIAPPADPSPNAPRVPHGTRDTPSPKRTPAEELGAFVQNQLKNL